MPENDLANSPLHPSPAPRKRLGMRDHNAARLTLGRLIRMRLAGEISTELFRDLVYGLNLMLGFFKHGADLRIEDRLDQIEELLQEKKERKRL